MLEDRILAERVPAPNIDYFGCDRCGNMFPPQMRCDLQFVFFHMPEEVHKYQLCYNCVRLLTMTFRFTEARKVMEKQLFGG